MVTGTRLSGLLVCVLDCVCVCVCVCVSHLCSVQWHIDLWIGNDDVSPGGGLIACEDALSSEPWANAATVEVDAVDGHVVDLERG